MPRSYPKPFYWWTATTSLALVLPLKTRDGTGLEAARWQLAEALSSAFVL